MKITQEQIDRIKALIEKVKKISEPEEVKDEENI